MFVQLMSGWMMGGEEWCLQFWHCTCDGFDQAVSAAILNLSSQESEEALLWMWQLRVPLAMNSHTSRGTSVSKRQPSSLTTFLWFDLRKDYDLINELLDLFSGSALSSMPVTISKNQKEIPPWHPREIRISFVSYFAVTSWLFSKKKLATAAPCIVGQLIKPITEINYKSLNGIASFLCAQQILK